MKLFFLILIFHYTILSNAQDSSNIFVIFDSMIGNHYTNNGNAPDTIYYLCGGIINADIYAQDKEKVTYKFDKDYYQYSMNNNKVYLEQVYIDSTKSQLFREKKYYYHRNKLQKIRITFNACCGNEEMLPADYIYFIYDSENRLIYAISAIDKKINHKDDVGGLGNEINRDNFSISNIYKFEYSAEDVILYKYIIKDIAITTRNLNKLNRLCDNEEKEKRYFVYKYTSTDNNLLKANIIDIIFPKIYLSLYGYNGFYVQNR